MSDDEDGYVPASNDDNRIAYLSNSIKTADYLRGLCIEKLNANLLRQRDLQLLKTELRQQVARAEDERSQVALMVEIRQINAEVEKLAIEAGLLNRQSSKYDRVAGQLEREYFRYVDLDY